VIAEGIETEEQLEELRRLGCRRGQGYLLAPPMTAASIAKLLREPKVGTDPTFQREVTTGK
jgi:EAL domain-containing protein (putative c-di-GMP-specific phosphodiesterase class I)